MPNQEFFPPRPAFNPMIYAYTDTNPMYKGLLKVGYTAIDVQQRVAQQYPTVRPGAKPYTIVFAENAMHADGSCFTDHEMHTELKRRGFANPDGEWFRCTANDVRAAYIAVMSGHLNAESRTRTFGMRPEQRQAVEKTMAYFASSRREDPNRSPKFLWNAKMRFGKTFASYQLAKKMDMKRVLSRTDWDSFEISWDFKRHPLICGEKTVAAAFSKWECKATERFDTLKANEEELNRIFIDIYGLQDELTPEVEDKDVTVRRADLGREIRSLISYAVGCMFGRYSLDVEGLAYAGGDWDAGKYRTFIPDKDNILPICDDEYFDDDIVGRFVDFIRVVYGAETLEDNLKFVADALGGRGTSREVIRSYFLNDFYADHCKVYQKRPIYWLFDSGKKNGFKALVYLHRYSRDLLAKLRTDYVHEQQERYRTQLSHIAAALNSAAGAERARLLKQQDKLSEQLREISAFEERVHHLADQNIAIDLDDGVKRNYEIFADILAKI